MAEAPAPRKRATATSRAKVAARKPTPRTARAAAAVVLDEEPRVANYGLRLTEGIEDEPTVATYARPRMRKPVSAPVEAEEDEDTFALSLSKALEAINAHTSGSADSPSVELATEAARAKPSVGSFFAALDKLPPIRLPIGPAIPWRLGLPALIALVIVMGVMSRTAGASDAQGVQLAAQQTPVAAQQEPLFAQATPVATAVPTDTPDASAAQQSIGVQEPAGLGFDFVDIGIKLIAVLGLAYGSLLLLKKVGVGGSGSGAHAAGAGQGVRVVSSLALAPNRSVHVIRVPGGKTLLVGATPNAVNLLADLGELDEDEAPEAASFLEALKGKLH